MPVQLSVKSNVPVVRKGLADYAAQVPKIARKDIYDAFKRAEKILQTPGAPSRSPVRWDSVKQRKAYFASNGFGHGIPYARTGALPKAWRIERTATGYRFVNQSGAAVYVYGNYEGARQSRIHSGRWPVFQNVVENAIIGLPQVIESHLSYYGRAKFG